MDMSNICFVDFGCFGGDKTNGRFYGLFTQVGWCVITCAIAVQDSPRQLGTKSHGPCSTVYCPCSSSRLLSKSGSSQMNMAEGSTCH
jgi:hypothetical protein